ncbi:hypothetical protein AAE478_000396 [Parahypoxylon ruwenzoriense]
MSRYTCRPHKVTNPLCKSKSVTLDRVLGWVKKMERSSVPISESLLRDDPTHWAKLDRFENRRSGDHANAITHESAVEEDSDLTEGYWFRKEDRDLYFEVYGLTVKEGGRLRECSRKFSHVTTKLQHKYPENLKN